MKYRIVIEGEASSPPPDYAATLRKVVAQETKFMLGKAWDVVSCEELPEKPLNRIVEVPNGMIPDWGLNHDTTR